MSLAQLACRQVALRSGHLPSALLRGLRLKLLHAHLVADLLRYRQARLA